MNLLDLQPELLLTIFSYIDSRFLITTVCHVCKEFYNLIYDDYIWKKRIVPTTIYRLLDEETVNWKKVVCTSDTENCRWKNNAQNMNKYLVKVEAENAVYHIHLLKKQKVCICAGCRDNSLKFWNLEKLIEPGLVMESDILADVKLNAHSDWITSIASSNLMLCTGSWDTRLNIWDVESGCVKLYSAKCGGDIICLHIHGTTVAAGFQNGVKVFDVRRGLLPVYETVPHGNSVLQTYMNEKYIITLNEDWPISVYDRNANKVLTTLKCANNLHRISCGDEGFLFGGDSDGVIHVWDMTKGIFKFIQSICNENSEVITGLLHTMGCLISSTQTGKLEVFSLTNPMRKLSLSQFDRFVSEFQYDSGVMAIATYNDVVNIYKPK